MSVSWLERGRNKLSVTLDLKSPEAQGVFADLVRTADVVVENFSAGTADRIGVGYERARELNPRIVYLSISGFGVGHPGKGMDTIFQALSGLMTTPGNYGDPPVRNAVPFGDLIGPLFGVIGTLSALLMRERTGQGQHVDVALLGALTSLIATEPWDTMERAGIEMRTGNVVPRLAPFGIFTTTDGNVALCAPTDAFARGVFAALGRPELEQDERFSSRDRRVANSAELHALIAAWAADRTSAEVVAGLDANGVPVAVVRDTATAVRDPRALGREETMQLSHPQLGPVDELIGSGFPVKFSGASAGYEGLAGAAWRAQRFRARRRARLRARADRSSPVRRRYLIGQARRLNRRPSCPTPARSGERQEPEESAVAEESGPPGEYQAT